MVLDRDKPVIPSNPEVANGYLNDWLEKTLNQVLPMRDMRTQSGPNKAPWYTPHLRDIKQHCKKAERNWRKDFSPSKKQLYREMIRNYKTEIKLAQTLYFSERITLVSNSPRETFLIVRQLLSPLPPSAAAVTETR